MSFEVNSLLNPLNIIIFRSTHQLTTHYNTISLV